MGNGKKEMADNSVTRANASHFYRQQPCVCLLLLLLASRDQIPLSITGDAFYVSLFIYLLSAIVLCFS